MRIYSYPGNTEHCKKNGRYHLDQMGIGQELTHIPWGSKKVKLPPSKLGVEQG